MKKTVHKVLSSVFILSLLFTMASCGNSGGGGGSTGTGGTTPGAPTAFGLTAPADNATGISLTPTFTWENAPGETSFTLQVSADAAFTAPLKYENTAIAADTASFTIPSGLLVPGTQYYWKVIAVNAVGTTTATGAPFSFTTTAASGASNWSVTSHPSSTSIDNANGIAKDATGVYVVGYDTTTGHSTWRIEKRGLIDGSLVSGFGSGGVITGLTTTSAANAIAIDSTYMYVVGYDTNASGSRQWRIEKRNLSDGALVTTTFGDAFSGIVSSGSGTFSSAANAIAIDGTYMYVAGYGTSGIIKEWRIEKRYLSSGTLESTTFGASGVVTGQGTGGGDIVYGIAVDAAAVYVVGSDKKAGSSTPSWRIEKLNLSTGATITAVEEFASVSNSVAYGVAVDTSYLYVVGYDTQTTNLDQEWRIEKRNISDCSIVYTIQNNPATAAGYTDNATAIAIDGTNMYVGGFDAAGVSGTERRRVEKRSLADGSLVTSFNSVGYFVAPTGNVLYDEVMGIAVDSTSVYTAGFESLDTDNEQWRIEKRIK